MTSPHLSSDFHIVRRFPVLRGARSAVSISSGLSVASHSREERSALEPDSLRALDVDLNVGDSRIHELSAVSRDKMLHDSLHNPVKRSFDGMPEQLVYGLFERRKNVRYVMPQVWSPPNPRQV